MQLQFHPSFYKSAAVCSVLSAITTLGLIFLPHFFGPVEGFEARMRWATSSMEQPHNVS